jgi:hypothetical protein
MPPFEVLISPRSVVFARPTSLELISRARLYRPPLPRSQT